MRSQAAASDAAAVRCEERDQQSEKQPVRPQSLSANLSRASHLTARSFASAGNNREVRPALLSSSNSSCCSLSSNTGCRDAPIRAWLDFASHHSLASLYAPRSGNSRSTSRRLLLPHDSPSFVGAGSTRNGERGATTLSTNSSLRRHMPSRA